MKLIYEVETGKMRVFFQVTTLSIRATKTMLKSIFPQYERPLKQPIRRLSPETVIGFKLPIMASQCLRFLSVTEVILQRKVAVLG